MGKSKIEWTDVSWNPMTGCTKISPGCKNCYAERMAKRLAGRAGYPRDNPFRVTLHPDRLEQPLHWKKPRRVFVCSMGDLFHEDVPFDFISQILILMWKCPQHTFIILTKRPENLYKYFSREDYGGKYLMQPIPPNAWFGVTAENQEMFDKRWAYLKQIAAAVYMISYEPALGPLVLPPDFLALGKRAFVVCGGESGPGARPMHPAKVRSVRDQCVEAGVSFFFKQWGEWTPYRPISSWKHDMKVAVYFSDEYDKPSSLDVDIWKVGKKAAGRELDGQVWDQMPGVEQ